MTKLGLISRENRDPPVQEGLTLYLDISFSTYMVHVSFCTSKKDIFPIFGGIEKTDLILPSLSSASSRCTIKKIESLDCTIKGHDEKN